VRHDSFTCADCASNPRRNRWDVKLDSGTATAALLPPIVLQSSSGCPTAPDKPDSGTATAALKSSSGCPTIGTATAALKQWLINQQCWSSCWGSSYCTSFCCAPMLLSGEQHQHSGAKVGGGGRQQRACDNMGVGCNNHRVLDCSYGLCGPCCATVVRDLRCNVAKHSRKNKHN